MTEVIDACQEAMNRLDPVLGLDQVGQTVPSNLQIADNVYVLLEVEAAESASRLQ